MKLLSKISYQNIRTTTFSVYIVFSILFCLILVHLGRKEIEKAREYAENERQYLESIVACNSSLNAADNALAELLSAPADRRAYADFRGVVLLLRKNINTLAKFSGGRGASGAADVGEIRTKAQLLASVCMAFEGDIGRQPPENSILADEDFAAIIPLLDEIRGMLQSHLASEVFQVETWQRQSQFYFSNLQSLLIVFFILTTAFSVSASLLFGYILRRSLTRLSEGTKEISAGNLGYRFDNIMGDEIGKVMFDFNTMAHRLEKQTEALQKANRELHDQAALLAEANRHKDRFLANMSHELRTPLNSILGFSDLIVRDAQNLQGGAKTSAHAQKILVAAEHLLELISGLLEIAKADAGVIKPSLKEFDLSATIASVISIMRPLAENKKLDLRTETPPGAATVVSDEKMIRQILINLLNNAVKFTPAGHISVALSRQDAFWLVAVSDTGIGISPEDQKAVFKDFHRLEAGLTSNYEGVGLGLTLSKRLVELLGGSIKLSSELGKGSTFSFTIPAKPRP